MFRRIRDGFGATHFTVLALGAMFVPTTLYAVVSYQPVAIVSATTGSKAQVDAGGRLYTYDPVVDHPLAYAYDPANLVKATGQCSNTNFALYTPPSGKSIFIRTVNVLYYGGTVNADNYAYVYGDNNTIAGIETPQAVGVQSSNVNYYTSGVVDVGCGPGSYRVTLTGYLVPSSATPPVAEAKEHESHVGSTPMKIGERR